MENFDTLKNLLIQKGYSSFSISKQIQLLNITWSEIEDIILKVFKGTNITIALCSNEATYVPIKERDAIFSQYHDTYEGSHAGVTKTLQAIREKYYWENLKEYVQLKVTKCEICQKNKLRRVKTRQSMQLTDIPQKALSKIGMDICGPISTTKNGNKYILVIQCQLSRFVILVALKDQTAETIADSLIKRFICIFGSSCCVLTDKGAAFCSKIIEIIANRFKFKKIETTAFSAWENRIVERSN